MKNWKYIEGAKVGNIKDDKKSQQLWEEMQHAKKLAEDWAREIHRTGKEEYKGSQKDAEEAYRKAKREYEKYAMNAKTGNEKTGAEEFFKQLSDDVKEREKKDDADIEKVGNFKTGKSALKPGDRVQSYGVQGTVRKVEGENSDNIYGEPIIEVEWDNGTVKKVGEHYLRKIGNKVGNALDWDENLVGKFVWVKDKGQEWKVYVMQDKGDKVYIRNDDGSQGWVSKTRITGKVGNSKTGNEASDDKFAYVMREFDEGKLKTPDGKVVTDPAQAKAIAYSESKKTENGLARARKAMACNKKVKNSAVREYKHSDGRVAQIDFNEDGTDADMSIYEGTKEIEQKNFSTIRDAEQYVTSHGFRRI